MSDRQLELRHAWPDMAELSQIPELHEPLVWLDMLGERRGEAIMLLRRWLLDQVRSTAKIHRPSAYHHTVPADCRPEAVAVTDIAARHMQERSMWPSDDGIKLLWACWNVLPKGRRTPLIRAYAVAYQAGHHRIHAGAMKATCELLDIRGWWGPWVNRIDGIKTIPKGPRINGEVEW